MRGRTVKSRAKGSLKKKIVSMLPVALMTAVAASALFMAPRAARASYRYVCAMQAFKITELHVSGLKYVRQEDFINYIGDPKGGSILDYDMNQALRKASASVG